MELREFLYALRKEWKLLLGTVVLVVGGVFLWQAVKPDTYQTIVSLHIARSFDASQKSDEYRYGDFYRLQADERFADTVVRWLLSPAIVLDILKEAEIPLHTIQYKNLTKQFQPKRLSSQFIEVRFLIFQEEDGKKIADGMRSVLNKQSENLNIDSPEKNGWFVIVVDTPITYLAVWDWKRTLIFTFCIGGLFGVWLIVAKEYIRKEK